MDKTGAGKVPSKHLDNGPLPSVQSRLWSPASATTPQSLVSQFNRNPVAAPSYCEAAFTPEEEELIRLELKVIEAKLRAELLALKYGQPSQSPVIHINEPGDSLPESSVAATAGGQAKAATAVSSGGQAKAATAVPLAPTDRAVDKSVSSGVLESNGGARRR
eukprot:TRINITY_DN6964_c0_g1_i1.p1 TRINITY_DN6964_c0_g1~~TRINITY_DN6964_c0_g1_i1.p1  ORF type:complete len:162 (-),score=26.78 TRINITY_DN6964_c0_g1_i1:262-747(-)